MGSVTARSNQLPHDNNALPIQYFREKQTVLLVA
jgi:hypothetical protein